MRLVHEGRSLPAIVRALRRAQEASRVLLEAAAIHVHQLGPGAGDRTAPAGGVPGADGVHAQAGETLTDEFAWFDQLRVDDAGQVDTRQLAHESRRSSPRQDTRRAVGPGPLDAAHGWTETPDRSYAGGAARCADSAGTGEWHSDECRHCESADAWHERLGMGLSHGQHKAMCLAMRAVAHLHQSRPLLEPAARRPQRALRSSRATRSVRGKWQVARLAPSSPRASQPLPAEPRGAGDVATVLAPGLDAAQSVALPGVVLAVSEAPHLLRRRFLSLPPRAAAAGTHSDKNQDDEGPGGGGHAQGRAHDRTRACASDVSTGWRVPDGPALRSVRLVVGATGALRRWSQAAVRAPGAEGAEGVASVTTTMETGEELQEYERLDARAVLEALVQKLVKAGCHCLLLQDSPSPALSDLLHARGATLFPPSLPRAATCCMPMSVRHCHTPPTSCLLTISSSSRSLALQHARAKTRMRNAPVLVAACERGTRVCVLADVGGCVAGVLVAWGLSPSEVERVCSEAHVAPAPDFADSFSPLLHLSPVCVNLGQCLCAVCVGRIVGACMRVEACVKMCIPVYASTQFTRIRTCMYVYAVHAHTYMHVFVYTVRAHTYMQAIARMPAHAHACDDTDASEDEGMRVVTQRRRQSSWQARCFLWAAVTGSQCQGPSRKPPPAKLQQPGALSLLLPP